MTSKRQEIAEVESQLQQLKGLRGVLGDEITDQKLIELEARLTRLRQEAEGGAGGGYGGGEREEIEAPGRMGPGTQTRISGGELRGPLLSGRFSGPIDLSQHYHVAGAPIDAEQDEPDILLQAYYRDLAAECSRLPLGVVDPRFAQPGATSEVSLPSVYTDLHVVSIPREGDEDERRYGLRLARGSEGERTALLDAVTGERGGRLALVGDAGSGKTTFVDYLTYRLAEAQVTGQGDRLPPSLRGLLPVRLVLRRAGSLIPTDGSGGDAQLLWRALEADIGRRLGERAAERLLPVLQGRLLDEAGGGLILLDGLDEVPEAGSRRRCLLDAIQRFAGGLPARSRVLLTARPYAYADPKWHLAGFGELALAPFDAEQVGHFIDHWYQAVRPVMGWDEPTAVQRGQALRQAIEERDYLGDLASRPLLLTLMATLHTSWGQLPEDRADLYEESVKLLLSRWQTGREVTGPGGEPLREPGIARALGLGEKAMRQALDRLAFDTHEGQAALADRDEAPADVTREAVIGVFASLCPPDMNPKVLLEYLETRAGLLIARREGIYAFPHRSFQEYLAACHLANTATDFGAELRRRVWDDPAWWREVYLLGVGKKRQGGLGDAVNLVNTLVPASPADTEAIGERHWQAAVLGAKALLELKLPGQAAGQPHYQAVHRRVCRWLAELLQRGELVAKDRLEAGDLLGRLGDPRPGVGVRVTPQGETLPDIDWLEIPAGPGTLGSGEEDSDADDVERPAHEVELPAFRIARYPLTNAQFRPFLDAGGYDDRRWWTEDSWAWRQGAAADLSAFRDEDIKKRVADWLEGRPQGRRDRPFWWDEPPWDSPNRPVVGVSWHEALAYCRWLQDRLRQGMPGARIGLPSEAEWEKAARGDAARRWPWGNDWHEDHANTRKAGLETTSPVGLFPAGASPCRALDLAGNVWEWTRSKWGSSDPDRPDFGYPYDPTDGRGSPDGPDLRVVRGGSWYVGQGDARCACRLRRGPVSFFNYLGFRLALSLADSGC